MDTALESLIEHADAVGGEEEDPLEVFKSAEEDGNEGVAFEILVVAILEEDVGFVEEEDGGEGYGVVEDFFEALFQSFGVGADVAAGHEVEGLFEGVGHAF